MRRICFFLAGLLFASEDSTTTSAQWNQYIRGGYAYDQSDDGYHTYYRIKRETNSTFHDLRLYGFFLGNESIVYARYKSSRMYQNGKGLYQFTTFTIQKNSKTGLKVRYHFNQGLGYFITRYSAGHVHTEIAHAFDMSDYLNDNRKTSYIKWGLFWDHNFPYFIIRLDIEKFYQISEVVNKDQSRWQYFADIEFPMKKNRAITLGLAADDQVDYSPTHSFLITFGKMF